METKRRTRTLVPALALLLLLITAAPVGAANPVPAYTPQSPLPLGSALPYFSVMARDGSLFTRSDLAPNRPTLIVFTNTWGLICQAEAGIIARVAATHPKLQVVIIGTPDRQTPDDVFNFPARFAMPFPAYYDGYMGPLNPTSGGLALGQVEAAWGITGYPAMILTDAKGVVHAGREGYITEADLNAIVNNVENPGA